MKRIIKWLNYCYYRSAKWYSSFGDPYFDVQGEGVVCLAMTLNILSVVTLALSIKDNSLLVDYSSYIVVMSAILSFILFRFIRKDYSELDKMYRLEKNSIVKGRYVLTYILGSALVFISLLLFR